MKNFSKAVGIVSAKASCFLGILCLGKIKTHDYLHLIYTIRTMCVMIKAMFRLKGPSSVYMLTSYLGIMVIDLAISHRKYPVA